MTELLPSIAKIVDDALFAEYPQSPWRSQFEPILDLTLGDIGSNILQRVSHELRLAPHEIGDRILPRLHDAKVGTFEILDGFLNVRLENSKLNDEWQHGAVNNSEPRLIIVAPRKRGTDPLGYARVIASASLQWFLSAPETYLRSSAGELKTGEKWVQFKKWFIQSISEECNAVPSDELLNTLALNTNKAPVSFWGYADFLPRKKFSQFIKSLELETTTPATVHVLDRVLTTRFTDTLEPATLLSFSDEELAALVIYLSRSCSGTDIDLTAVRYNERANIRWSTQALVERLSTWKIKPPSVNLDLTNISPEERALILRWRSLPHFRTCSTKSGKIGDYLSALEDMVERTRRYINNPVLRVKLEHHDLDSLQAQIIAGAMGAASDTINACFLFRSIK